MTRDWCLMSQEVAAGGVKQGRRQDIWAGKGM